jgi:hypothetical protein
MAIQIFGLWMMLDVTLVLAWAAWRQDLGSNQ